MKRCDELEERLLDSLDHPDAPLPDALETHLAECGECASFYTAARQLDSSLAEHFAALQPPDRIYRAVRRKAIERPALSRLHGVAELLNWLGALALAVLLARYAGVDFAADGVVRWAVVALLSALALYPGWLLSLSGEERSG